MMNRSQDLYGSRVDEVEEQTKAEENGLRARFELTAKIEPFDSFWEAPEDIEKGYASFYQFYRWNYLKYLPGDRHARILVISCGPGYFVNLLNKEGYRNVLGI